MPEDPLRTGATVAAVGLFIVGVFIATLLIAPGLVGAEASYVVQSDSMSPAIGAGDVVVLQSADTSGLETGTIITYRSPGSGERVTHRIVEVQETADGTRYRTKGDANEEPDDELIAPDSVEGTVWFTIPFVGYLVVFASSTLGIILLVLVPAALLAASELYNLYQAAQGEADQEGEL